MLVKLDVYIGKHPPLHDFPNNRKCNFGYITELIVKVNVLEENSGLVYDFDIGKISKTERKPH